MTNSWESVTPDVVLRYDKPCSGYMCPLKANIFNIDFQKFEIKDYDTGTVVFQISSEPDGTVVPDDLDPAYEDMIRCIKYSFPANFLTYKTVRTMLEFSTGNKPINNFRMIERHYFKNQLVRSFDFTFGFCIPNGTNTWEAIYDLPQYTPSQISEYVSSPGEHKSDSFYFADEKLVMHNKAEYRYV